MGSSTSLAKKVVSKLQHEGLKKTLSKSASVIKGDYMRKRHTRRNPDAFTFADVVFINGCDYSVPHPIRYRVDHQIQQLESNGLSAAKVDAWDLTMDHLGGGRCFVIFRCPITPFVEEFIKKAQSLNKKVIFDIDDLVVDTRYTDTIEYLDSMSSDERALYDDGVQRMGATLKACGSALTTTERLAVELGTLVPEVFINRNTASEEMLDYSNRALFERDVLPSLPSEKVEEKDRQHWEWAMNHARAEEAGPIYIGYFSGSITHNDDFAILLPVLASIMESRRDVRLKVVGELDIPKELEAYADRIETVGFCDWQQLPSLIASVDINIAPLRVTVFNEAKSENKWVEASLVKVPTVASNVGAFAHMIENGVTGLLCDTNEDWQRALLSLVDDQPLRKRIANAAHEFCLEECTTVMTGQRLARYLRSVMSPNVFMLLPSLNTSGGILAALRHCCFLQDAGMDVGIIDCSDEPKSGLFEFDGHSFPVVQAESKKNIDQKVLLRGRVDMAVATMWTTVSLFDGYSNIQKKKYLVQGYETLFYEPPTPLRVFANATYSRDDVEYLTVSKWCESWLSERFGRQARYIPNGLDTSLFFPKERSLSASEKVRILIEGDCDSYYKNVDEAFRIVDRLDPERYEVWYVSYNAEPKSTYRVDRFLHDSYQEEIADIYRECHMLLKTSILESFSYPPLEMMASGGYVVAILNDGNAEYLRNRQNCLVYERGDLEAGVAAIEEIARDSSLRATLYEEGLRTAQERSWERISTSIVDAYES